MKSQIKIGELDCPIDYFEYSQEQKEVLCTEILNMLLHLLDRQLKPEINRMNALDMVLESSIITNQKIEKYEVCALLKDIRNLINE